MKTVYAGLLSVFLNSCCSAATCPSQTKVPEVEAPENVLPELQDGRYRGALRGREVEYEVLYGDCRLSLLPLPSELDKVLTVSVHDYDCDNTVDSIDGGRYWRGDLVRAGRAEHFDRLLEEAQKMAVPENKFSEHTEELDKILAPFRK